MQFDVRLQHSVGFCFDLKAVGQQNGRLMDGVGLRPAWAVMVRGSSRGGPVAALHSYNVGFAD
jgi:hypothetical protein